MKKRDNLLINAGGIGLSLLLSFAVWALVVFFIGKNEKEILKNRAVSENSITIMGEAVSIESYYFNPQRNP